MRTRILHKTQARRVSALAGARADHRQAMRRLAHDLRNPLNSILLMAQLLEETCGAPEAARIASRIQKQCSEMNGLLDKALESLPG